MDLLLSTAHVNLSGRNENFDSAKKGWNGFVYSSNSKLCSNANLNRSALEALCGSGQVIEGSMKRIITGVAILVAETMTRKLDRMKVRLLDLHKSPR